MFYSIPNYFDLGKVTKQSCSDAAKSFRIGINFVLLYANLLLNTFQNIQKLKFNEIKYHKTYLGTHAPGLISVHSD